ncbi:HlyD family efflux transporter periplasmic adaptor subunit [uncultured Roseivirga sp.]|uniref:HlyD family secretion protein n=1 Tax=uncultured Roseivirga sp. TaxID=543088 RepID=UPI0030DD45CC|tara:strand:+ start:30987 stop:32282 length:1296 start_codon:yes stop_codon:yes gene_type:complete
MSEENNHVNIELRSEEIQDILTRAPKWMIQWGNSILILIILVALMLSYIIKYPDVITGKALISTKTPPVYIISKVNGRIGNLIVQNGQTVEIGGIIAEIDNPVSFSSIQYLESFLESAKNFLKDPKNYQFNFDEKINLYDATPNYLDLKNLLEEYQFFLFDKSAAQKLVELKFKRDSYLKLKEITIRETELNKADLEFAEGKFKMKEQEFKQGLISQFDFLNAQYTYNQSLISQESIKKSIIQMDITRANYQSEINDFTQSRIAEIRTYKDEISGLISSLQNYIIRWNNDFTIRSPANGRLDYLGRVKVNQLIDSGDRLFAIVSPASEYEVELEITSAGFGKVKVGQEVKLKLDNYPYNDFGFINAKVIGLPVLPNKDVYKLKVELTNGLNSSYDIDIKYSPEMMATAEIITEDLRLVERLFSNLRSVFEN